MDKGKLPLFKVSIRTKLLLASLSLLVVPWLGYQYIQGLESYLRSTQAQRLLDRVTTIASLMDDRRELFQTKSEKNSPVDNRPHIYARPLRSAIQLDGYVDDWRIYKNRSQSLGKADDENDLAVSYRLGVWNNFLYLLLEVQDDAVVYRQPDSLRVDQNDHLRIGILDRDGNYNRYYISTISPGWASVHTISGKIKSPLPYGTEYRIKAEWQQIAKGYNIELRVPVEMIGDKIAFAVADVDDATDRDIEDIAANADTERVNSLGTIAIPTTEMESLLQRLQSAQSRVWVVDADNRVIGLTDHLNKPVDSYMRRDDSSSFGLMRLFYQLLLKQPSHKFVDPHSSVSYLNDPTVSAALAGKAEVAWRVTENEEVSLITAAYPVYVDGRRVGAVAIEETSNSILILQNRAIEALVSMSLLVFVLTMGVLLVFATRLSMRVRRLRDEVDASVAPDGRVQKKIKLAKAGDELGDLGRSFSAMHERLSQYNRYLETMASKLGHELRTPITIVRSSLDNLENAQSEEEAKTYLRRANEGVSRLSGILTRMSEATHLEQTVQQEQVKEFCLNEMVTACVNGYQLAHSDQLFEFENNDQKLTLVGSPELLAQMLDKLVSNALDFADENTPVTISLSQQSGNVVLRVANQGPSLPEEMRHNLFDSMVSMRHGKSDQPHLGLGLYIVRLIAEFHHGHVDVANLEDEKGVVFSVVLPMS